MPLLNDPVCGAVVDSARTDHVTRYENTLYFFCSKACRRTFEHDPGRYRMNAMHQPGVHTGTPAQEEMDERHGTDNSTEEKAP